MTQPAPGAHRLAQGPRGPGGGRPRSAGGLLPAPAVHQRRGGPGLLGRDPGARHADRRGHPATDRSTRAARRRRVRRRARRDRAGGRGHPAAQALPPDCDRSVRARLLDLARGPPSAAVDARRPHGAQADAGRTGCRTGDPIPRRTAKARHTHAGRRPHRGGRGGRDHDPRPDAADPDVPACLPARPVDDPRHRRPRPCHRRSPAAGRRRAPDPPSRRSREKGSPGSGPAGTASVGRPRRGRAGWWWAWWWRPLWRHGC